MSSAIVCICNKDGSQRYYFFHWCFDLFHYLYWCISILFAVKALFLSKLFNIFYVELSNNSYLFHVIKKLFSDLCYWVAGWVSAACWTWWSFFNCSRKVKSFFFVVSNCDILFLLESNIHLFVQDIGAWTYWLVGIGIHRMFGTWQIAKGAPTFVHLNLGL